MREGVSKVQLALVYFTTLRFLDNRSESNQSAHGDAEAGFDKLNIFQSFLI